MTPTLNASSRIMYEAAQKLGIACTTFSDHETILMEKGGLRWYVRGSRTSFQSSIGKTIADYKPLTKEILTHFEVPTAKFAVVKTEADLEKLTPLTFPVVVKPLADSHGNGVVVGVPDSKAVWKLRSERQSPVLVEEMLRGTEYRIVCINYKFEAAAFRKPAFVTGDGNHTIQELIAIKNEHPWRGEGHTNNLSLIKVDASMTDLLDSQGFTLDTILATNQEVILRKTANLSTGGEAWDVTDDVCPENRDLFEKIAKVCDLNIAGIDIMCDSLKTPLMSQAQAGVIEVNASPGLRMHHFPIQGHPRDLATLILHTALTQAQSRK